MNKAAERLRRYAQSLRADAEENKQEAEELQRRALKVSEKMTEDLKLADEYEAAANILDPTGAAKPAQHAAYPAFGPLTGPVTGPSSMIGETP
jgi:hypothetical protein